VEFHVTAILLQQETIPHADFSPNAKEGCENISVLCWCSNLWGVVFWGVAFFLIEIKRAKPACIASI